MPSCAVQAILSTSQEDPFVLVNLHRISILLQPSNRVSFRIDSVRKNNEIRFVFKLVVYRLQVTIHSWTNALAGSKEKIHNSYLSLYVFFSHRLAGLAGKSKWFYLPDRIDLHLCKIRDKMRKGKEEAYHQHSEENDIKDLLFRHSAKL